MLVLFSCMLSALWIPSLDLSFAAAAPIDDLESEPFETDMFEGDIAGIDVNALSTDNTGFRNAVLDKDLLWPGGTVPYVMSSKYTAAQRAYLNDAMWNLYDNTCVVFTPRSTETDYIYFGPGNGCWSNLGRVGGRQTISLPTSCWRKGIVLHEMMHAIGFYHEQARTDRDDFVDINWNNIRDADAVQFRKYSDDKITAFGQGYDFDSVMHYGKYEFAIHGDQYTIRPKAQYVNRDIGQRQYLSPTDSRKINLLYQCKEANRKTCAYMWDEENYGGLLTIIYDWNNGLNYSLYQRNYRSARLFAGCKVTLYTTAAPNGGSFSASNYFAEKFSSDYQSRVTKIECVCTDADQVTESTTATVRDVVEIETTEDPVEYTTTEEDVVTTEEDVVTTEEDVVTTEEDVVTTDESVVTTCKCLTRLFGWLNI